jgi:magnesium transporter
LKVYELTKDNLVECSFKDFIHSTDKQFWLIINTDELEENIDYFNFSYQTVYDCVRNDDDTPKLDAYDNYSFGIINIIEIKNFFKSYELDFYLTKNSLIFVSKYDLEIIDNILLAVSEKGTLNISLDKILYLLFDKMTIKDYDLLSNLENEIFEVEEDVIEGKTKDYITDIVSLKKKILFLKKQYEPLLDVIEDLYENENEMLNQNSIAYFKIIFNRIERLNNKVKNLSDYTTQVRESYQAQIEINTNNTMKIFTVLTAIFYPLSLIVGWYGMNFVNMPEITWKYGYIFVICLSISVVAFGFFLFKKKKWL